MPRLLTRMMIPVIFLVTQSDVAASQAVVERGVHVVRRGRVATPPPAPPPPNAPPPGPPAIVPGEGPPRRQARAILSDTTYLDRFERIGDTLRGRLDALQEGGHIDYRVVLGPRNVVRLLETTVYAPLAAEASSRFRWRRITLANDSMVVTSGEGVQRFAASGETIPMFPAALALQELLTRRAQANGGTADVPVFWIAIGETFPSTVRRIGSDSLVISMLDSPTRVRVDALGRILGGVFPEAFRNDTWVRAAPDAKMGLIKVRPDTTFKPE